MKNVGVSWAGAIMLELANNIEYCLTFLFSVVVDICYAKTVSGYVRDRMDQTLNLDFVENCVIRCWKYYHNDYQIQVTPYHMLLSLIVTGWPINLSLWKTFKEGLAYLTFCHCDYLIITLFGTSSRFICLEAL